MKKLLILLGLCVATIINGQYFKNSQGYVKTYSGKFATADTTPNPSYPSILDDGNTEAWYDAQDTTYLDLDGSDNVVIWYDRSSNGWNLTPAQQSYRPLYVAGSGVTFITDDAVRNSSPAVSQPYMIYALIRLDAYSGSNNPFFSLADNWFDTRGYEYATPDRIAFNAGSAVATEDADQELDTWHVVRISVDNTNSYIQVDEHTQRTGTAGTNNITAIMLGAESTCADFDLLCYIIRSGTDTGQGLTDIYNYFVSLIP